MAVVAVFFFVVGLGLGIVITRGHYQRLDQRLRQILVARRGINPTADLAIGSQLAIELEQQQKRQQHLEAQVAAWIHILRAAPIGYLQVDEENRLHFINQKACQLLYIAEQEAISRVPSTPPRLLLELVRSYELDALIEATRRQPLPQQSEWLAHRVSADPSRINRQPPVPLRGYGISLSWGHVGIFIEDRQEAVRLAQQRDRWASDVAHELKTPLTSIRLVAETLRNRVEPALAGWVDRLINETIRLSDLVQDLLDLSRLEGHNPEPLNLTPVNVADLIQRAWQSLEPLAMKKHMQLDYEGPATLHAQLDEPRIFRVLLNLLDNAIKHGPERSVIQIRLEVQEAIAAEAMTVTLPPPLTPPCLVIEVIDAGHGFALADLPYVFDRFYRVDPSRARVPSGGTSTAIAPIARGSSSGLGLAIVRQIVEAHRGVVQAHNHPETGGGWLQVFLPLLAPSPPTSSLNTLSPSRLPA